MAGLRGLEHDDFTLLSRRSRHGNIRELPSHAKPQLRAMFFHHARILASSLAAILTLVMQPNLYITAAET
ncbi:hypothetical protein NITMOv2_4192 [Nitrospira moscoviensis]|uniref:Uncharacterized protein n=1 Tax=Nitrospira moscoviensis TaxID=42253 RepID=A0A0K2GIX4_NITMO|nr:hypothetical protein NITMOv2_4192 [Nitrospira moscoviensis]